MHTLTLSAFLATSIVAVWAVAFITVEGIKKEKREQAEADRKDAVDVIDLIHSNGTYADLTDEERTALDVIDSRLRRNKPITFSHTFWLSGLQEKYFG